MGAETGRGPRLAGRRILITGAASGIGAATARIFTAEGARLGLVDLQAEKLTAVAAETGAASAVADLRDPAAVAAAVDAIAARLGGLDGLVCNAGIGVSKPLADTTDEDWARAMDINAGSVFFTCRARPSRRPSSTLARRSACNRWPDARPMRRPRRRCTR